MALISCSECGNQVSDKATACPKCGNPISAPAVETATAAPASPPAKEGMGTFAKLGIGVGIAVVAFLLFGFLAEAQPGAKEKASARDAISECRRLQDDPLKPIEVRRFIKESCEGMVSQFIQRYGHAP